MAAPITPESKESWGRRQRNGPTSPPCAPSPTCTPSFHLGVTAHTPPLLRTLSGADISAPRLHQNTKFPSPLSLHPSEVSLCFTPPGRNTILFGGGRREGGNGVPCPKCSSWVCVGGGGAASSGSTASSNRKHIAKPPRVMLGQSINQSIHQQLLVNTLVEPASLCATGQSLLKTQENKQRPKETSL